MAKIAFGFFLLFFLELWVIIKVGSVLGAFMVILLMIFGAAAFSYWNAARAAAEHAERLGRNACSAADVILLDQTVQASGIRLRRNHS